MTPGDPRGPSRWAMTGVGIACVATLVAGAGPLGAGLALASHLAMAAPGVALARAVAPGSWLAALTFGPMVGFALSTFGMFLLWAAGLHGGYLLVVGPALAWLLIGPARRLAGRLDLPAGTAADRRAVLLVLCLVPLLVARPFSQVGATRPEGQVYRAYFTADYVWRRALVAEIVKEDFPPKNPFYRNDPLHYYWFGHLPDAVKYRAFGRVVDVDALLLGSSVMVDLAFVLVVYGLARLVVPVPWAAAAGAIWAFLFTSFEGVAGLWVEVQANQPWWAVRYVNIDAVTRWFFNGMPIDGIHRILWYQPHHALAYSLGFIGLVLLARRRAVADAGVFLAAGVVFGLGVLVSSFVALMAVAAACVYEAGVTLRHRAWRPALVNAAWAALPLMAAVGVVTELQYIDHQPGVGATLMLGLNEVAARRIWRSAVLSAGPILALGAAGAWVAWRRRIAGVWPLVAVVASSIVIYFYVDIRDHEDVYVGWRVGHVMFIALAGFVGLALHAATDLGGWRRHAALGGVALLALGAAPMTLIDAYNTQDVTNQTRGPSFRWTLVLTPAELDGLRWLRAETPPDAVVQVDPVVRHTETWAYLPAFAERRMAVGLPLGLVPLKKYEDGSRRIRRMYDVTDPAEAYEIAARSGVDYIVVGGPERQAHPGVEERLSHAGPLLPLVFHNDALSIYHVERHVR